MGRLIALVLAAGFAALGWYVWQDAKDNMAAQPVTAESLTALTVPDDVADCIDERLAQINKLVEDGLMDADSAALSEARARSLCVDRN